MTVHLIIACYGVRECESSDEWECERCATGAASADCSLCLLRGGALKPTNGGRWAHLSCALAIPEVTLGDETTRGPVVTDGITRARRKLVSYNFSPTLLYLHDCGSHTDSLLCSSVVHCVRPCLKATPLAATGSVFSACGRGAVLHYMSHVPSIERCQRQPLRRGRLASSAISIA